jgi:CheY-like chemotaxis protein
MFLCGKQKLCKVPLSPKKSPVRWRNSNLKTILFVDDHEVLARLSCDILEMNGYKAISAYSGADALAKFDGGDIDLVVTDFRMDGMNGLELANNLRKRQPDVPIIMVTGYGKLDHVKDITVLTKDTLFPTLLDEIKQYLGDGEAEADQVLHAS